MNSLIRPLLPLRLFQTIFLALLFSSLHSPEVYAVNPETVTGVVFHDLNGNGRKDSGEPGISGILVSNGDSVVKTDPYGRYRLQIEPNSHIFVIKPRDWETPVDSNGIPRFYYTWSPDGAAGSQFKGLSATGPLPESVDFPIYLSPEPDRFRVLVFGDTQPRDIQEIHYLAHDTIQEVAGTDALFGITLGDLVFDDLDLFQPLNEVIGTIGIPWRHVIGNHDIDYSAGSPSGARGAYYRTYGPSYHAFSAGSAHFVVVDNIRFITGRNGNSYRTGIGEKQLNFIENFLLHIPDDELVVFLTHIPWAYSTGWEDEAERERLFELLASHSNSATFAAHAHRHFHRFLGPSDGWPGEQPHHLISMGTTCGAWWSGAPDEYNIPHSMMRDGTPTGYAWLDIDGSNWKLSYKASRRPEDFQMHIHAPDVVSLADTPHSEVHVNIFNALPDAVVEMRFGEKGPWVPLSRLETVDPFYVSMRDREREPDEVPWRVPGAAHPSLHLWSGSLPEGIKTGTHLIYIRAKDRWHRYEGKRVVRVTGSE